MAINGSPLLIASEVTRNSTWPVAGAVTVCRELPHASVIFPTTWSLLTLSPTSIPGYQNPTCPLRSQMKSFKTMVSTFFGFPPRSMSYWRMTRLVPRTSLSTSLRGQIPCPPDSTSIPGTPPPATARKVEPAFPTLRTRYLMPKLALEKTSAAQVNK